jgi:hypothetical protein
VVMWHQRGRGSGILLGERPLQHVDPVCHLDGETISPPFRFIRDPRLPHLIPCERHRSPASQRGRRSRLTSGTPIAILWSIIIKFKPPNRSNSGSSAHTLAPIDRHASMVPQGLLGSCPPINRYRHE